MENGKTIIEVNGVKLEVDLRTARRIDEIRIGDRVKVLIKGYSDYKVHAGTVIGFEPSRISRRSSSPIWNETTAASA